VTVSDVHCPATLLLTCPGEAASDGVAALTFPGRTEARRLAESLADRRVALVYTADELAAVQTAEVVAGALGLHVQVRPALGTSYGGAAELEDVADGHRGETVLVVAGRDALASVVPTLLGAAAPVPQAVEDPVELAVDADGWVLRSPREGVGA
jgi:broad specificity phosphatase PhoE